MLQGIVRILWARAGLGGRRTYLWARQVHDLAASGSRPTCTGSHHTLHQYPRLGVQSESGYKSQCTDLLISGHRRHDQLVASVPP